VLICLGNSEYKQICLGILAFVPSFFASFQMAEQFLDVSAVKDDHAETCLLQFCSGGESCPREALCEVVEQKVFLQCY